MPGGEREVKAAKALALPTRSAIFAHLLRSGPLTAREVAGEFDLHPNVARAHLDLLEEAGFLQSRLRRQGKGRPAKAYFTWEGEAAAVDDWEVSPPGIPAREQLEEQPAAAPTGPNPYRLIAAILVRLVERFDPDDLYLLAEKVAAEEGRKLMLDYRRGGLDFPASVRAVVEEFRRFSPGMQLTRVEPDEAELENPDCPFKEIALEHSDLVLVMDPALTEGAMAALGHRCTVEAEASVARGDPLCRMVIRVKAQSRRPKKGSNP